MVPLLVPSSGPARPRCCPWCEDPRLNKRRPPARLCTSPFEFAPPTCPPVLSRAPTPGTPLFSVSRRASVGVGPSLTWR